MKTLILNIIANESANTVKEIMNYVTSKKSYFSEEQIDARRSIEELISEGKIRKENVKVDYVDYLVPAYFVTDEYAETHLHI